MFKDMAQRQISGENEFIKSIMDTFNYNRDEATAIFQVLLDAKVLKRHAGIGRYTVKHGAFWESDVMDNALAQAKKG